MTKEEKLLYAIGEIDDELILTADGVAPGNIVALPKKQWKKAALTAACFLLCVGVWFSVNDWFRMGSTGSATSTAIQNSTAATTESAMIEEDVVEETEEETVEESALAGAPAQKTEDTKAESGHSGSSGSGTEETFYISYNTPLLPLDIRGDSEGITAQRTLTIDAGNYYAAGENAAVTDEYLLLNTTNVDTEVTVEYRYGDSIRSMSDVTVTVEGSPISSDQSLQVGNTFTDFDDDGMNLYHDYSWEAYEEVLSQDWGSVDEQLPSYGSQIVTVYEIYDPVIPADVPDAASLAIRFNCPEDTLIWNNNFNGLQQNGEERCYDVFVSEFDRHPLMSRSVWVFGDAEPLDITVDGYVNGSCETELPGLTAKVRSYTMTLEEAVNQSVQQYEASNSLKLDGIDTETLTNAVLQYLEYSPLGSDPQSRYDMLLSWELYSDVLAARRLFTLEQTIVIPANSSVQVRVRLEKQPNQAFESRQISFEVAAKLGSELDIDSTLVNFTKPELGTVVEGNLSEGETALDLSVDHWYVICDEAELCSLPQAE